MTRIFDNIQLPLLPTLRNYLKGAKSADFCVGYFKLRGWQEIDDLIQNFNGGEGNCCRLLVGMQNLQNSKVISTYSSTGNESINQKAAQKLKKKMASEFRKQLSSEVPTTQDEERLRRLIAQVKANKLIVKLNSKTNLHAKLYLIHRLGIEPPIVGILGSSNLTLSGLSSQGELNVEFTDNEVCAQLQNWFNDRWKDQWCIDVSEELAEVVTEVVAESVNRVTTENTLAVQSSPSPSDVVSTTSEKKKSVGKNEVSLHSDVGLDYTRLRNLLVSEEWAEADRETARAILKVTRRQEEEDWEAEEWDEEHLGAIAFHISLMR